ncbi:sigma-70 family RNA polymerase sigma factor [Asanoa sp. WMMD1127]|uniref:sigma-70 family RNA polymerase sigma factor n=1 Tax=Asanoa sp. WMMD1127 TaxID=3016107 RepID=UPI002417D864|nr:sigma-70 family RNA polymerase sigma factor [Asanoa sp. WMMD1127]MDG4824963.1 sigma-70 family RNA polymerase sigma factor [Asanoa sp. WMMD1127]
MPSITRQSRVPAPRSWQRERVESNQVATAALSAMAALPADDPSRERLRETVISTYLPMARRLAKRYHSGREPLDDLNQVAAVGLIHAVDRFDPGRCDVFPAFAVPNIVGELRRHFRDKVGDLRIPRSVQELGPKLANAREALAQELGREPTSREVAERVEVTVGEAAEANAYAGVHRSASLDKPAESDPVGAAGPDRLGADDPELARADLRLTVHPLVAGLPARERSIVWQRFWLDRSQSEIAADLGISQMHVSRLLGRAIEAMHRQADGPSIQPR